MTVYYKEFIAKYKSKLESELEQTIENLTAPTSLKEAMNYSLTAGGKRIRPLLLFATIDAFGKDSSIGMKTACALEMIHTYSLIHDDLPSMDDDDTRRGKPTNHKVFGEAMAILAGDGLLTLSFQVLAKDEGLNSDVKVWLIEKLADSAGPMGMVAGQVADIEGEQKELDLTELKYVHLHKTGKLLTFGVIAGAKIAGATDQEIEILDDFSYHLGLAFQISDDILDVIGDENLLGKPVGSDDGKDKSTYPSILTLEGAKEQLTYHTEEAKNCLKRLNKDTKMLAYLTELVAGRNH